MQIDMPLPRLLSVVRHSRDTFVAHRQWGLGGLRFDQLPDPFFFPLLSEKHRDPLPNATVNTKLVKFMCY